MNTRTRNFLIGIALLAIVAMVIIGMFTCWFGLARCKAATTLYVYGGYRYFEDEEIMAVLREKYNLEVKGEFRKGTSAMSDDYDPAKRPVDCIFPGSKTGIDYFQAKHPGVIRRSEVEAEDRIVIYTWRELLPALEKAGLVTAKGNSYFIQMTPLIQGMIEEKRWSDIGVDIPNYVRVEFTEPISSSSGLLWLAMVGNYLVPGDRDGQVLTVSDLQANPAILEALRSYWENQGNQMDTTGKLFPKFIAAGTGIPMVVAYESNYVDWYVALPDDNQRKEAQRVVGVYPETTINTEHILASLTPACDPLLDIFKTEPKLQQLAWDKHGLRHPGVIYPAPDSAPWFAATVNIVPEPKKDVTDAIKFVLK